MSVLRRKAKFGQFTDQRKQDTPLELLQMNVGQRICETVYGSCDCKRRLRGQVCDTMRSAAQAAMHEITQKLQNG